MDAVKESLHALEAKIGYQFHDLGWLKLALTHSSYANERRTGHAGCNERLEFLGDAVLELVSSEFLYDHFPDMPEGELTRLRASLVCEPTLAYDARQFGLEQHLLLGKGEEKTGGRGRDSVVSDALEATIGAVFQDGGFEAAKAYILRYILDDVAHKQLFHDSKTRLQEQLQSKESEDITYTIVEASGPDHDKQFRAQVHYGKKLLGEGSGHSKKAAEQQAAFYALVHRTWEQ